MRDSDIAMQVDRVKNLLSNFGWKVAKQKVTEKDVELVIELQIPLSTETEPTK
jgi:hypothetical protein